MKAVLLFSLLFFLADTALADTALADTPTPLTQQEAQQVTALSLDSHPAATDQGNHLIGNPDAITLGKQLFFDQRLSGSGHFSCASCHDPQQGWSTAEPFAHLHGGHLQRHTPTLWNVAYNRWLFWDGRADSLWSQALESLESEDELQGDRTALVRLLLQDQTLLAAYRNVAEDLTPLLSLSLPALPEHAKPAAANPDQRGNPPQQAAWAGLPLSTQEAINHVTATLLKSIASFEATLQSKPTRFDQFATRIQQDPAALPDTLNADEYQGLRLFIGKAACIRCHNGPLLSDGEFHRIFLDGNAALAPDQGRYDGIPTLLKNPFNSQGTYADGAGTERNTLAYLVRDAGLRASFKTPGLRNLTQTAPYMHDGRFTTLEEVADYYNQIEPKGHLHEDMLRPLHLDKNELAQLVAFLKTLSSPIQP